MISGNRLSLHYLVSGNGDVQEWDGRSGVATGGETEDNITGERSAADSSHIFSRPEGVPPQSSFSPASLAKQGTRILFNDQTEARVNTRVQVDLAHFTFISCYKDSSQEELD